MTGPDLRSFVSRTTALISATPPSTGRETRAWIVDPLLETLGWDRHAESTITDTTVEDVHLEYVLAVESVPVLFVAVEPYGHDLTDQRARNLLEAMAWTGVDRAIYTNGHSVAFVAGTTDATACCVHSPRFPTTSHPSSTTLVQRRPSDSRRTQKTLLPAASQSTARASPRR